MEIQEAGPTGDDVRRLRPGEVDPDPEVKPARPDPVDMDEDEKEMLSEARARLANTQGKKAKRKAREKQLEEARRLATLQKKRELKAAGITIHIRKKNKGVDYNADIPFQKRAPAGFWAVDEEKTKEEGEKERFRATELQKLDGKRRRDEETEAKKREAKKQKKDQGDEFQAPAPRPPKVEELFSQRKKLVLPAPQVGEAELEEIVKIGYAGEAAKAAVDAEGASTALLSDYTSVQAQGPMRTPRTAPSTDNVMIEARNLRAMTMSQTPLLGEMVDVVPANEGGTGFEGITPRRAPMQTPNPLAAQLTPREGGVGFTPRTGTRGGVVGQTPLRDEMGINDFDNASEFNADDGVQKRRLADMFASLPKPKNDFEIVVPDADEERMEVERADREEAAPRTEEDMADRARRLAEEEAERERKELERRSSAVKRGLPRPASLVPLEKIIASRSGDSGNERVDRMIAEEVVRLIIHDAVEYPVPGQQPVPEHLVEYGDVETFTDEDLAAARALIEEEVSTAVPANLDEAKFDGLRFAAIIGSKSEHDLKMEHLQGLEELRDQMGREAERAARIEKKLQLTLGGYQARSNKFKKDLAQRWEELQAASIELQGFIELREREEVAVPLRISTLKEEVESLQARERTLQEKYKSLMERRSELAVEIGSAGHEYSGVNGEST